MKRRTFLQLGAMASVAGITPQTFARAGNQRYTDGIVIASGNGMNAVELAYKQITEGADALDATIAGVTLVENDPNDMSVGYGGLPNAEGIVELDSCCMHGPTHNAGAVGGIRNIKNPAQVARAVLKKTKHVLLVGQEATHFAVSQGFKEENLLTEGAKEKWLEWKNAKHPEKLHRPTGTISCLGIDQQGNISGVTTTSGLAFKIPGRVGDSPIIGAGLYVDNEVGASGSTGWGEENLVNLSSFLVVEFMKSGNSPEQACRMVIERIIDHAKLHRTFKANGNPDFNIVMYALNKSGEYGSCSIFARDYAVCDANGPRKLKSVHLY